MNNVLFLENEVMESERDRILTVPNGQRARQTDAPLKTIGRVLVVDDEPDIAFLVKKRLENAGYEVIIATDGISATQMSMQRSPDVIVLDIGMPCGDGHTVASRIRNNPNTALTPIIYLTARTSDKDRSRAAEAGAFAYLTKPFIAEELVDLVNQAVSYWR